MQKLGVTIGVLTGLGKRLPWQVLYAGEGRDREL